MNWFFSKPNPPPTPPDTPPTLPTIPSFGSLFADPHYEELEKKEITKETSAGAK